MALAAAALSGILAVLAYPFSVIDGPATSPADWWSFPPLILVAYVPLFVVASRELRGRRRFLLGWITGAVHIACMQRWIGGTLVAMSHFPEWAGALSVVVYGAWAGLGWGLMTWCIVPARERLGPLAPWLLAVAFAFIERYTPVLFPFHLAGAFFETPALLQAAELVGVLGLSVPIWALNLTLAELRRGEPRSLLAAAAPTAVCLALGLAYSPETPAPERHLDVLMVQPNVTTAQKNAKGPQVRMNVYRDTVAMTRAAIGGAPPDVIVWPEGGFPFTYTPTDPPAASNGKPVKTDVRTRYSAALRGFAKEIGRPLITGSIASTHDGVEERDSNSALFFAGAGAPAHRYDKRMLLLFGERVPFADTFPALRDSVPGMSHHLGGQTPSTWEVAGVRLALTICYEAIFADFARDALAAQDAHVLLNLTNDVWFGHTVAAAHHLMVQVPRALENRRWLVRSTNSGISAFVSPSGELLGATALSAPATTRLRLPITAPVVTFYARFGDWPLAGLAAVLGLVAAWRRRRAP